MSRPKSTYKSFEVVSPITFYGAIKENKRKNKKVIFCVTNSPKKTWEMVARQYVHISHELDHNRFYLHSSRAKDVYKKKIKAGLAKAFDDGVSVVKIRLIPAELLKGKVIIKELRPVDDRKIVQLVTKVLNQDAA